MSELLATPDLGHSSFTPPEHLISDFRYRVSQVYPLLAGSWERADMIWYFTRLVCLLSIQDYTLFQSLYKLVYKVDDKDLDIHGILYKLAAEERNGLLFLSLRDDDYTASELEQEEATAFGCRKTDKGDSCTVAR